MPTPLSKRHLETIDLGHIYVGMKLILFSTRRGGKSYGYDLTYPSSTTSKDGTYIKKRGKGPYSSLEETIVLAIQQAYTIR